MDSVTRARRRRERERQAVIFGVLVTGMIIVGLGAFAIYTGNMDAPFGLGDREFTQPQADASTTPPCLPSIPTGPGETSFPVPIPYGEINLRVLNASGVAGVAAATETVLEQRGFNVDAIGDFAGGRLRYSEIRFGQQSIVAAYTLAGQFTEMRLVLDDRLDDTLDLIMGAAYQRPMPEDDVVLAPDISLENATDCLPADRIIPLPAPVR